MFIISKRVLPPHVNFHPSWLNTVCVRSIAEAIGIHEILEVTPEVAQMIMAHKSALEIQEQGEKEGMVLMWEDGFIKALKGITTIDEVVRVSKE